MGHALVDEFCRAGQLQPLFFRRCQRIFRDEVQPQLDERERLLVEVAQLRTENAALKADNEELLLETTPTRLARSSQPAPLGSATPQPVARAAMRGKA